MVLKARRLEIKVSASLAPSEGVEGDSEPVSPLLVVSWQSWVFLACRSIARSLPHLHMEFSLFVGISRFHLVHKDTSQSALGTHPSSGQLHLNQLYLQWVYFQIRSHFEVLGIRTFGGHTFGGNTTQQKLLRQLNYSGCLLEKIIKELLGQCLGVLRDYATSFFLGESLK